MTKRILAVAMAAMLVMLGSISVFAATEPTVTSDAICYISYQTGNNDYDGQSMDTAKKQFLTVEDNGCISVLADGGTLIVCGKAFIGGDYIMPELGSTLKITSSDGKTNYKNSIPLENPACAMKMRSGVTLTLQQDTIIDDIILFQESAMNTIAVTNNSTLVIGDKVECMSNINSTNPCYMAIDVEKGSTVILNGGIFEQITGEGTVVNNGATIQSEQADAPATSAAGEPTVTTEPVQVTEDTKANEPAASGDDKPEDTAAPEASTDAAATEETTVASETTPAEESKATTEASKETEPDASAADTSAATEPAPATEGGLSTGAIIGIIAAVVVVIAAVVVVIVKKKK